MSQLSGFIITFSSVIVFPSHSIEIIIFYHAILKSKIGMGRKKRVSYCEICQLRKFFALIQSAQHFTNLMVQGKSAKRARASQALQQEADPLVKAPHSFVFHRGPVGDSVLQLVQDLRKVMEPFTASKLRVKYFFNVK